MAPVRRYLRISKYSVLECRIYLDNPALAQSWLLNPRNPKLPRVIESIRPLVLPKLREEKERSKKKSSKTKGIKDVVVQDDFEVSIFLTETSTRHSLLTKHKHFHEKAPANLQSNSSKLISETNNNPVDVEGDDNAPIVREEDDDDQGLRLEDIPLVGPTRRSKRRRNLESADEDFEISDDNDAASAIEVISDEDSPPYKRQRGAADFDEDQDSGDDKKKLAMDLSYEGFAIYGRVLCLVVTKRDNKPQASNGPRRGTNKKPEGQAMMENWISSTQMPMEDEAS